MTGTNTLYMCNRYGASRRDITAAYNDGHFDTFNQGWGGGYTLTGVSEGELYIDGCFYYIVPREGVVCALTCVLDTLYQEGLGEFYIDESF